MGRFTPVKYIDLSCDDDENKLNVLSMQECFNKVEIHTSNELNRQNTEYKRYKLRRSHY